MNRCPHDGCNREFHEAELTETVAGFFDTHRFDPEYSPEADDSPIVCIGSLTYGPTRPVSSELPTWTIITGGKPYGYGGNQSGWQSIGYMQDELKITFKTWIPAEWKLQPWQSHVFNTWSQSFYDEGYNWVGTFNDKPISSKVCNDEPIDVTVPIDAKKPAPYSYGWTNAMHALAKTSWDDYHSIPLPDIPESDYAALAGQVNEKLNYAGVK